MDPETGARLDLGIAPPELVPSGRDLGPIDREIADELGISRSARLVAGGHDHFVGAFGSGVRATGDCYLSAGTSEALLVLSPRAIGQVRGIDEGRFVDEVNWYLHASSPGGHVYGQWRRLLYPGAEDQIVRAEVTARAAPPGCLVNIDAITHRASLQEIPMTADRSEVLRCVVEGAAVASAATFDRLAAAAPDPIVRLIVAGHAAGDHLWRSLRLGLIGRPMEIIQESEVTAIGAALLARAGVAGNVRPIVRRKGIVPSADDMALASELRRRYGALERIGK